MLCTLLPVYSYSANLKTESNSCITQSTSVLGLGHHDKNKSWKYLNSWNAPAEPGKELNVLYNVSLEYYIIIKHS